MLPLIGWFCQKRSWKVISAKQVKAKNGLNLYEVFWEPKFREKISKEILWSIDTYQQLNRCRIYHFHDTSLTAKVRLPCYIEDNQRLHSDGGNLPAMLYLYQQNDPVVYRRIVNTLRKMAPFFGDFVLEPRRLDPTRILLNWRQKQKDYLLGPHQLSDGTLRALALVTLLLQPERDLPSLIILDESELGLHPHAVEILVGLICSVSQKSQVILATQSPTFVDFFQPEEIIVTELNQGCSEFRRLDSEEFTDWLEDYSVGELWQKNVIGGGPLR